MNSPAATQRRRFLQASLIAGGAGLSLADILRQQAFAESAGKSTADTSVIQIWLGGGPSQFETFDPKPEAPVEIRGPYSAIQTKLPGILFCETLPRTAMVLDRAAIIRTVRHATNDHLSGAHWCSTGYPSNTNRSTHPSSGAMTSRFRGAVNLGVPAYVLLSEEQIRNPEIATVMGAAYLGSQHAPFTIIQDPFQKSFQQDKVLHAASSLKLADDFTLSRVADRRSLLRGLDRFARQADATRAMDGIDSFTQSAFEAFAAALE